MTQHCGILPPLSSLRAIVSQIRNRRLEKQRALTFWESWVLHHVEGPAGGRKPPIQFTSEELKQKSQKDVAKEAEGSAAMGDDLCAWQGAGERGVGEGLDSRKMRLPCPLGLMFG